MVFRDSITSPSRHLILPHPFPQLSAVGPVEWSGRSPNLRHLSCESPGGAMRWCGTQLLAHSNRHTSLILVKSASWLGPHKQKDFSTFAAIVSVDTIAECDHRLRSRRFASDCSPTSNAYWDVTRAGTIPDQRHCCGSRCASKLSRGASPSKAMR